MKRKYYEVEISKHDNRAKNGKRNETSMCIVGVREPSIKEAEKFLADDIIRVYKCTNVDKVREISKEEAYSFFDMENESDFPVFGQ